MYLVKKWPALYSSFVTLSAIACMVGTPTVAYASIKYEGAKYQVAKVEKVEFRSTLDPEGKNGAASIRGHVWYDVDRDGIQDGDEQGAISVVVKLYDGVRNPLDVTLTDHNGNYSFTELSAGEFQVEVVSPKGYQLSAAHQGLDAVIDSDIDPGTNMTAVMTVGADWPVVVLDGGLTIANQTVSGRIWTDLNQNSVQDDFELGFPNIQVKLYHTNDELIQVVYTDQNGDYHLTNVAQEVYYVIFELPVGFVVSQTKQQTVTTGQDGRSINFFVPQTSIPFNIDVVLFPDLQAPPALRARPEPGNVPTALDTIVEPDLAPTSLDEITEPNLIFPRSYMPITAW